MEPERWGQIKRILNACLDLDEEGRDAYARSACQGDPALLDEVRSLLASHAGIGDFLASSLFERERDWLEPGIRLGAYEILEPVAEGGMGTVYRGVRARDFEKQVAIKVVKRGMDTDSILQRFRHERQILAGLDHPNIARLLDGGATGDGRPYLVMEYVEGEPITGYCEDRSLAINERLELFRIVCSAVQYAHQNLVVHRDLKPDNILVTPAGVPKLLDFGIARLLESSPNSTLTSLRFMTPECASPEQVRGEPITTVSDIYSLGVLLYQLLTGKRPYHFTSRNAEEIRRIVCEQEPKKPSAVRPVAGDLDNIVLKAMNKDPGGRYPSADQFSEDVERFLRGLPVKARRRTLAYSAAKFIRRHRAACLAAGLAILSLVAGITATLWEAHISARERRVAEQRLKDVRALATSNLFEINDAIEQVPGSAAARHLLIQRALEQLDKLLAEGIGDRELMREVATGYERIGVLQGRFAGVGDSQASLASLGKALAIRSSLLEASHHDARELKDEATALRYYTGRLLLNGETQQALNSARKRLAVARELATRHPDQQAVLEEADADSSLAWVLGGNASGPCTRQFDEAIALDRSALQLVKESGAPTAAVARRSAWFEFYLATHYLKSHAYQESLRLLDEMLMSAAKESDPRLAIELYNWRGNLYEHLADHRKALADYGTALALARKAAALDPSSRDARLEFEILHGLAGAEEARLGDPRKGLAALNSAIETVEPMLRANPERFFQRILLVGYSLRGEVLSQLGDQARSRAEYSRSLTMAERLAAGDPVDLDAILQTARARLALGIVWARDAHFDDARREVAAALAAAKQLLAARPADAAVQDIAQTAGADLGVLAACIAGTPCARVRGFQLPSLIE